MSDTNELDLDGEETSELNKAKKTSGLAALLPNLLKFVAIGLGALIFIVTVSAITYNILNKRGTAQTAIPANSPYVGARPQYMVFTSIGPIRTATKDINKSYAVVVEMVLAYDQNDTAASGELTSRLSELKDFVRRFFRSKLASELQPENEAKLKSEIRVELNDKVLSTTKVKDVYFIQLDVMEM